MMVLVQYSISTVYDCEEHSYYSLIISAGHDKNIKDWINYMNFYPLKISIDFIKNTIQEGLIVTNYHKIYWSISP